MTRRLCLSRDRGSPSGLTVTAKQAHGPIARPDGYAPCGLMEAGKRAEGGPPPREAYDHAPSWSQGSDGKDAALGARATGMRSHRRWQGATEIDPFAGRARPSALIEAGIGPGGAAIHEEGLSPRGPRYPHQGKCVAPIGPTGGRFARVGAPLRALW